MVSVCTQNVIKANNIYIAVNISYENSAILHVPISNHDRFSRTRVTGANNRY